MLRALLPVLLVGALAGGCYDEGSVGYEYGYNTGPSLEYVAPGVQVVSDLDYPVFFSDGYYWRWYGGYWYSSPYWDRGWTVTYNVPVRVRGIHSPWAYAHYHRGFHGRPGYYHRGYRAPEGGVWTGRARRPAPVYRGAPYRGPAVRGAPTYRPAPREARPGRPIVRDHRRER